jgi:protein Mpv17
MSAGDAMFQAIRCKAADQEIKIDLKESLRMALIGFTLHGPLVYSCFRWVDKTVGTQSRSFLTAAKLAAVSQVTFFPVFSTSFFTYMGLLEGLSLEECKQKVIKVLPPTILTGTAFWPAVTVINFMYVPPAARVLFVNGAGLFWNAWISYENAAENAEHLRKEEEKNGVARSKKE